MSALSFSFDPTETHVSRQNDLPKPASVPTANATISLPQHDKMAITLQNHVTLLQSFLSSPTTTTPQQAAEATLHITRAAAQSKASKPAINLAQAVLANLSKVPCIPAIPHLLSICENDPFEALDVFVLSSAAWKALVAAVVTAPPEPQIAMRVLSCALLNAIAMITKCLQPSTQTATEVVRTVKIAKFYCLNAARCSRAFVNSIQHLSPNLLSTPFLHLFDILALSSFVLLFDNHSLLLAHDELHSEVLPLVTKTLKTMLAMIQAFSREDREQVIRRALETTGKQQIFADLRLPAAVLQLLAVLHVTRCALDTNQQVDTSHHSELANHTIVTSFLIPFLFQCFDVAYEEVILFREQGSGQPFLDTVSSATADIVATAQFGVQSPTETNAGLDLLLEQVTSDNAIQSYIAQEVLIRMATIQNARDGWRDFITATVLACLRTSLILGCEQIDRWQRLAVNLCVPYVQEGKPLANALTTSRTLWNTSASGKADASSECLDDPVSILLLAQLCDFMSHYENESNPQVANTQSEIRNVILTPILKVFQLDFRKVTEHAQDLALASTGHGAVNAISLLPHVLDSNSACGAAISVLQRESSTPSMVCTAFDILDPSTMQPATVDSACTAATSAVSRYGAIVCPAISAFVSKAAYCLGENVSLAHWQRLSALLESCLMTSKSAAELDRPGSHALTGVVLHYAAIALSAINNPTRDERQTQATLPVEIVNDVEDALRRLERWRAGDNACDLEIERDLVREERYRNDSLSQSDSTGRTIALQSVREARERLLEAASLLLNDSNRVCLNEEVSEELAILQDLITAISRC